MTEKTTAKKAAKATETVVTEVTDTAEKAEGLLKRGWTAVRNDQDVKRITRGGAAPFLIAAGVILAPEATSVLIAGTVARKVVRKVRGDKEDNSLAALATHLV